MQRNGQKRDKNGGRGEMTGKQVPPPSALMEKVFGMDFFQKSFCGVFDVLLADSPIALFIN
jgi:hypothetical protein